MEEKFDIGEFVSYQLEEEGDQFKINLQGSLKYMWLIADKINEIEITEKDLKEYDIAASGFYSTKETEKTPEK